MTEAVSPTLSINPGCPGLLPALIGSCLLWMAGSGWGMNLAADTEAAACGVAAIAAAQAAAEPPEAVAQRIPGSQVVAGGRDIAWAWLGSPTSRYAHAALGSVVHAGSLHVRVAGGMVNLSYSLPENRVFEDRVLRLVDLDGDGRDEILLVEADASTGAALVVFGVRGGPVPALVELARGPQLGVAMRWINPVGFADFDGDGRLDVASVTTPHVGGVLTLHHFRPPRLVPYAKMPGVSNHRYGELEQQLAVIAASPGQRATVVLPDQAQTALRTLRWEAPGQWAEAAPLRLAARVTRLSPLAGAAGTIACARLADGASLRVMMVP